ncbi:MAG: hypothetical protein AB7W16_08105 [Candidatus Obscuribacterales bacterium]
MFKDIIPLVVLFLAAPVLLGLIAVLRTLIDTGKLRSRAQHSTGVLSEDLTRAKKLISGAASFDDRTLAVIIKVQADLASIRERIEALAAEEKKQSAWQAARLNFGKWWDICRDLEKRDELLRAQMKVFELRQ